MSLHMNLALRPAVAVVFLLCCTASWGWAQVKTTLSSPTGQVGIPLQLQYQFVNVGAPRDMPRSLMVDGLEIRLTGTSRRVEIVNMQSAQMFIFSYTVMPNRPGNFTIPGFAVQADGQQVAACRRRRVRVCSVRCPARRRRRSSDRRGNCHRLRRARARRRAPTPASRRRITAKSSWGRRAPTSAK